jgi:hypothetical protein
LYVVVFTFVFAFVTIDLIPPNGCAAGFCTGAALVADAGVVGVTGVDVLSPGMLYQPPVVSVNAGVVCTAAVNASMLDPNPLSCDRIWSFTFDADEPCPDAGGLPVSPVTGVWFGSVAVDVEVWAAAGLDPPNLV